jgi:hypothetical protein
VSIYVKIEAGKLGFRPETSSPELRITEPQALEEFVLVLYREFERKGAYRRFNNLRACNAPRVPDSPDGDFFDVPPAHRSFRQVAAVLQPVVR